MSIKVQEDKLFYDWKQWRKEHGDDSDNSFISDGVPCPEKFEEEKIKITFVLKDPNNFDPDGEEYNRDMRKWIAEDGAYGQGVTWNNIARWTQAVLDGGEYPYDILSARASLLNRISFLNLKKINGESRANHNKIKNYAKEDAEYIYNQLKIYQPDIIICCGLELVGGILHDNIFQLKGNMWKDDYKDEYNGCYYFYAQVKENSGKTLVLNCYHPQYTRYNEKVFYAISKIRAEKIE